MSRLCPHVNRGGCSLVVVAAQVRAMAAMVANRGILSEVIGVDSLVGDG